MSFKDFILIPALLLPVIPAILMGLNGYGWFYTIVWGAFYVIFGICEMLSVKFRKRTISKDIASTPAPIFWSIIVSWIIIAGGLSLHWWLMRLKVF